MKKVLLLASAIFCFVNLTNAQAGKLDPSFGNQGIVKTYLGDSSTIYKNTAIQKDGKIVVAGSTWNGSNFEMVIVRYNTDGSPDSTFSNNGILTTGFTFPGAYRNNIMVLIQNDGKIVAESASAAILARYNTDGTLDNTFSGDGKQTTNINISFAAVQKDGKIVVTGSDPVDERIPVMARYNTNGSPDKTFGTNGKKTIILEIYDVSRTGYFSSIAIQKDGKIVLAGIFGRYRGIVIVRFNADGSLDSNLFGSAITFPEGLGASSCSVIIQDDDKIVLARSSNDAGLYETSLLRYNIDGSLDNSFNARRSFQYTRDIDNTSAAIQSDGKIVVSGSDLSRFNTDGSLDSTFNINAKQEVDFVINDIAIANNKLYVAGDNGYGSVARYFIDDVVAPTVKIQAYATSYGSSTSVELYVQGVDEDGEENLTYSWSVIGTPPAPVTFDNNGTNEAKNTFANVKKHGTYSFLVTIKDQTNQTVTSSATVTVRRYIEPCEGIVDILPHSNSITIPVNGKVQFYNVTVDQFGNVDTTSDYIELGDTETYFYWRQSGHTGTIGQTGTYTAPGTPGKDTVYMEVFNDGEYLCKSKPYSVITIVNSNLPTVSLTAPTNNATYLAPAAHIKLTAAASDADGTISKVEFYNGTTLLHTETVAPYGFVWRNVSLGYYAITAKATDNSGNVTTSAPVFIRVVSNRSPQVYIENPFYGKIYLGPATIHLEAAAYDYYGRITRVEFYNGSTLLRTEFKPPYRYAWKNVPVGNYQITAKATDNWGAVTTSAIVNVSVVPNKAPTVSITNPARGESFTAPATIPLMASAKDTDGRITKVEFYNGTTLLRTERKLPYTYHWENVPAGTYTITAVATDNWGAQTTSAPVTVTVASNAMIVSSRPSSANSKTGKSNAISLNIYPNPAGKIVNIYAKGLQQNKAVTLSVISSSGVMMKTVQSNSSTQTMQLDVSSLKQGVYTIKVMSGDKVMYKQFVKL